MPTTEVVDRYDISTDGRTVWVNGAMGLLGRFGVFGIDIHRPALEQLEYGECLYCTQQWTTAEDWKTFQQKMEEHFGIYVPDRYKPKRFVNGN